MEYQVAIKSTKEGYTVWVPELKGCVSEGSTKIEALENIQSAISEYLAAIRESTLLEQGVVLETITVDRRVA